MKVLLSVLLALAVIVLHFGPGLRADQQSAKVNQEWIGELVFFTWIISVPQYEFGIKLSSTFRINWITLLFLSHFVSFPFKSTTNLCVQTVCGSCSSNCARIMRNWRTTSTFFSCHLENLLRWEILNARIPIFYKKMEDNNFTSSRKPTRTSQSPLLANMDPKSALEIASSRACWTPWRWRGMSMRKRNSLLARWSSALSRLELP